MRCNLAPGCISSDVKLCQRKPLFHFFRGPLFLGPLVFFFFVFLSPAKVGTPTLPASLLYVLHVLYLTRQAAEPPLSPASLLYVLYVLYLTRKAAEPPLSPSSLLYVLYVLYTLYARNVLYMLYRAI